MIDSHRDSDCWTWKLVDADSVGCCAGVSDSGLRTERMAFDELQLTLAAMRKAWRIDPEKIPQGKRGFWKVAPCHMI